MKTPDTRYSFVFDLAGVLLDWQPGPFYQAFFGPDQEKCRFFLQQVMGPDVQRSISEGEQMSEVLRQQATIHPDYVDAINCWQKNWHSLLVGEIEGSVAVLMELKERGYGVYALGNWSREEFNWALDRFGFLAQFDDVLLSGDCGILKPDEKIFALAERQFRIQPATTVFTDDRADNVHAAIRRNWNGIVFESPRHLYLTLMENGFL